MSARAARAARAMVDGQAAMIRTMLGIPPAPPEPLDVWLMVVGIPFDVWCAAGECRGPAGYVIPARRLAVLRMRRRLGHFRLRSRP